MAQKFDKSLVFNINDEAEPGVPLYDNAEEVIAAAESHARYLNEKDTPDWRCPYDKQPCTQECGCYGEARIEETSNGEEWTVWSNFCDNFAFNGDKKDKPK